MIFTPIQPLFYRMQGPCLSCSLSQAAASNCKLIAKQWYKLRRGESVAHLVVLRSMFIKNQMSLDKLKCDLKLYGGRGERRKRQHSSHYCLLRPRSGQV